VLDFGCGKGREAIEIAARGASRVIGLDIKEEWLRIARRDAIASGVSGRCTFTTTWHDPVDAILSLDAFEHFADPLAILHEMDGLLAPNGRIHISFGPTWLHPLGGHLFSVFPWSHLLVSERALIRWRSLYKTDGAESIEQAGLNRMTIGRFRGVVAKSPFVFEAFETVPIRRLQSLHNALTREFTTAIVRCTLVKRRR
jgi:SAM-dependent methyltransferase